MSSTYFENHINIIQKQLGKHKKSHKTYYIYPYFHRFLKPYFIFKFIFGCIVQHAGS